MRIDQWRSESIDARTDAADLEAAGYDGLFIGETSHDPFLELLVAAGATERLTLGTGVAIAFARSPMTLAQTGFDMARHTQGRFVLGLGSQVKAHVQRRFSMPWSKPAARMRELVSAMRAIWACWQEGSPLAFRGDFYTLTLMTPFFTPPPHEWGPPPVLLAAVNERMTEVAGEVCDGFFFHPLTTQDYLRTATLPALERGRDRAGCAGLEGFTIAGPALTCVGRTEEELAEAIAATKRQIGFYGSTPAYRPVLELHGWTELHADLTQLARQGRWNEMGDPIDDDVLHEFAVVGTPQEVAKGLYNRWDGIAQRISLYTPYECDPATLRDVLAELSTQ